MSTAGPARWLVTGARGRLARSFLAVARARGIGAVGLEELDIADADSVSRALDEHRPEAVLNAAAFTDVDRCESEPERSERANALGPERLARACAGRALLVHLSTDYVFDGREDAALPEDAEPAPLNQYGRSKLVGEQAVRREGGEHLVVRTQWLYGPGAGGNFVRAILARAAAGETLRVVRDEWGHPTWSGSLAGALLDVARLGLRGTLHLANRGVASRDEFAREIVSEGARRGLNPLVPVEPIERADLALPAERPAHAVLDLARASQAGVDLGHWREALGCYLDAEEEKRDA